MTGTKLLNLKTTDRLLKAMLVLSRTVDHLLQTQAIEASDQPLSKSKLQILRLLGRRGRQNYTRIAKYLGVSKPAVTQIVESLIGNELIRRIPSEDDRRSLDLALTPKGKKVFRNIQAHQRHLVRSTVPRSHPDRADYWVAQLQEITKALARVDRESRRICYQCAAHGDSACVLVGGSADCPFLSPQEQSRSRTKVSI